MVYLFFIPGKQVLQIKQGDAAAEAVILAHSSNGEVQRQVAGLFMAVLVQRDACLPVSVAGLLPVRE